MDHCGSCCEQYIPAEDNLFPGKISIYTVMVAARIPRSVTMGEIRDIKLMGDYSITGACLCIV